MIDLFRGKYGFLSNFCVSKLHYGGVEYPTSEHAYQAAKTNEALEKKTISNLKTPGQARRYGRNVTLRKDWEDVKFDIMKDIVFCKFTCNSNLKKMLLDTKDEHLLEGNTWHDNIWGNCTCQNCRHRLGNNLLGRALMEVRDRLVN